MPFTPENTFIRYRENGIEKIREEKERSKYEK